MAGEKRLREPWELLSHLHRGSSEVDWCERNYVVSSTIAEFVNTFSNVLFIIIPPVLIVLFQQYADSVKNRQIYVIWLLLIAVGLASAYFHATLSFAGQMLDELAILWLICAGFSMWLPGRYLPPYLKTNRHMFRWAMFFLTLAGTGLAYVRPVVNAFALMGFGLPISALLINEMRRCRDPKIYRLGMRTFALFIAAVACWLNDRWARVLLLLKSSLKCLHSIGCFATFGLTTLGIPAVSFALVSFGQWDPYCLDFDLREQEHWYTGWNFPYLHGFWHILVFLASYVSCVLFAYFDASEVAPQLVPRLRYWPVDSFEFGIPYVTLSEREDSLKSRPHNL